MAKEVTLVLVRVRTLEYAPQRLPVRVCKLLSIRSERRLLAAVVPRCYLVGTHPSGRLEEGIELDFAVTEHVRVGRTAAGVFVKHIIDHPLPVLFAEINEIKGYAYLAGDKFGDETVFLPFAVAVKGTLGIVPVLHKHCKDIISLPFEKQGGNGGIDTSRQSDADFHTIRDNNCLTAIVRSRPSDTDLQYICKGTEF